MPCLWIRYCSPLYNKSSWRGFLLCESAKWACRCKSFAYYKCLRCDYIAKVVLNIYSKLQYCTIFKKCENCLFYSPIHAPVFSNVSYRDDEIRYYDCVINMKHCFCFKDINTCSCWEARFLLLFQFYLDRSHFIRYLEYQGYENSLIITNRERYRSEI